MHHPHRLGALAIVAALPVALPALSAAAEPSPVLLDTDIGTGIGDALALGLAIASSELDVRGVTAVGDETDHRAMMLCRFLTATGRRHTAVAAGAAPQPSRPITDQSKYYYHPDPLFNRTTKPVEQSAADFLHARLKQRPGEVTLVALGPLTNIARLLDAHPQAGGLIHRLVLLESNIALDVAAARNVFASSIPLVVVSSDACRELTLDTAGLEVVFSPGTSLTRQIQTLYQMWDGEDPPLGEALAVAVGIDRRVARIENRSLTIDESGALARGERPSNAQVVLAAPGFPTWYAQRMAGFVSPARRPSRPVPLGRLPHRVHVAEDFDNDIERFWWMSGKPETKLLPPASRRACRGVLTHDFDSLLMASREMYTAVIFNPVPGPPMGADTRLSFRYWLRGDDRIRVQIYSLTNGYHRQLVLDGLRQGQWQHVAVDMTEARRPDGTGGPLGENERIDDIQFYADGDAELVIDDVVLYDAAAQDQQRPFPKRIMFSGVFDTGKQGQHWPGSFEIVDDAGSFWKAARSVTDQATDRPWIRLHLRGQRRLGDETQLAFRYRLAGADALETRLVNTETGASQSLAVERLGTDRWDRTVLTFDTRRLPSVDEVHLVLPNGAELWIDDLLLFEPGAAE